jgi:hypothetical protein
MQRAGTSMPGSPPCTCIRSVLTRRASSNGGAATWPKRWGPSTDWLTRSRSSRAVNLPSDRVVKVMKKKRRWSLRQLISNLTGDRQAEADALVDSVVKEHGIDEPLQVAKVRDAAEEAVAIAGGEKSQTPESSVDGAVATPDEVVAIAERSDGERSDGGAGDSNSTRRG